MRSLIVTVGAGGQEVGLASVRKLRQCRLTLPFHSSAIAGALTHIDWNSQFKSVAPERSRCWTLIKFFLPLSIKGTNANLQCFSLVAYLAQNDQWQ